jgi:hypothetical protein
MVPEVFPNLLDGEGLPADPPLGPWRPAASTLAASGVERTSGSVGRYRNEPHPQG